ncbi:sensor histidine kinase [Bacillus infantis]|uniref:sensor histidine kinase n=1 Tax=Bacillus infantis TaxID=324767 RepID=UPI001CD7BF91|nr:sensor histidine kinase [Bacillus infantis]MCA1042057.1 sensor histidine kinase [Bacillus infantis]
MNLYWKKLFPASEGWPPYIYLANFALPVYFMLGEAPLKREAGFFLLLIYLFFYRHLYWTRKYETFIVALMVGMTLLFSFFYNPLYLYLIFLVLNHLVRLPLKMIYILCAFFGAASAAVMFQSGLYLEPLMLSGISPPLFGGTILPFVVKASAKYKDMSEQLQVANMQIERLAQQEERQRIARELHDTLGHTLSLIALKSELTARLASKDPIRTEKEAMDIQQTARTALKEMRDLVSDMNLVRLEEEIGHAQTLCAAAGIEFIYEKSAVPATLTPLQERILAMCVRESITNVVKYSRAARCVLSAAETDDKIHLSVQDNGIGFDLSVIAKHSGNGLAGMKERLQLVEGSLKISSATGKGTDIVMSIPLVIREGF